MGRFVHTLKRQVGRSIEEVEIAHRLDTLRRISPGQGLEGLEAVQDEMSISPVLGRAALTAALASNPPDRRGLAPDSVGGAGGTPAMFPFYSPLEDDLAVRSTLPEVEDRRIFHPEDPTRSLRTVRGNRVRLRVAKPVLGSVTLPHGVAVRAKSDVIMCIRRHARRGVLLALGQGGGYHRKPRRSPTSDIWC